MINHWYNGKNVISIAVRASRLCLKLKEPWLFSKASYFSWLVYLLKMRVKGSTVIDKNKRFGMLSDYMRNRLKFPLLKRSGYYEH